ncbi:cysteine synthase A [Acidobacteria bacterium AH-259-A15]|nr:cysteine synthase A [Acidobacteria bacterium AH-259-A15]
MPRQRPLLANNILELIGFTPLVRLNRLPVNDSAEVFLKLESLNPMFSVKDRIAYAMLKKAQEEGKIWPGKTVIIEPTSGNTGIGLAMAAAVMGYRLILTMPDTMSIERRRVLRAMGAELVLTPEIRGMSAAIKKAEELLQEHSDAYMPQQFENPANPEIHRQTTAMEILEATEGRLNCFVAGVGTGGTITGVGEVLKKEIEGVQIIGVEPADSPVLSGGSPAPHEIQGIGAGFVPSVLNRDIIDEIIQVEYVDACQTTRRLARQEGIFAGISSGAICWAALQVAKKLGKGSRVVAIVCDLGERYLSHQVYSELDS